MPPNREMLGIKEFAKLTGIKESTLRYYDDLGLFKPAVRMDNGYRYYTPVQIITINSIRVLHDIGIPIKTITDIYTKRTPQTVGEFLVRHEIGLDDEIARLTKAKNVLSVFKRLILRGLTADVSKIYEEYRNELPIVMGEENDWTGARSFYRPFLDYMVSCRDRGIELDYPVGGYFASYDNMMETPSKPERFFSITPNGAEKMHSGMYVAGYAKGYYGNFGDLPERIDAYIKENNLHPQGPVYQIYVHDEISVTTPDSYLSCMLVPVLNNT